MVARLMPVSAAAAFDRIVGSGTDVASDLCRVIRFPVEQQVLHAPASHPYGGGRGEEGDEIIGSSMESRVSVATEPILTPAFR